MVSSESLFRGIFITHYLGMQNTYEKERTIRENNSVNPNRAERGNIRAKHTVHDLKLYRLRQL